MHGQTQIMWDFLETAFRTGMLDELFSLINALSGEEEQDMSQKFADLEEWFLDRDDFTSVDRTFETLYAVMQELTDADTMEGMAILLSFLSPLIKHMMEKVDIDHAMSSEMQSHLEEKTVKVLKALRTIISIGTKQYIASLGEKPAHQMGFSLGKSLNFISGFINTLQVQDANAVPDFMSGVFSSIDGNAVGKMTEILSDSFLDQKPPLFRWTAATAAKRAKKRLLNR